MNQELIRVMSEKLNRSGQDMEKALRAFGSAVNDRLKSEGHAELAGLGRLTQEGAQRSFEPTQELAAAVNYRWEVVSRVTQSEEAIPTTQSEEDMAEEDPEPMRKASWTPLGEVDPTTMSDLSSKNPALPVSPDPASERKEIGSPDTTDSAEFDPVSPLVDDLTFETLHSTFAAGSAALASSGGTDTGASEPSTPIAPPPPGSSSSPPAPASDQRPPKPSGQPRAPRRGTGSAGASRNPLLIGFGALAVLAIVVWIGSNIVGDGTEPTLSGATPTGIAAPADSGLVDGSAAQEPSESIEEAAAGSTATTPGGVTTPGGTTASVPPNPDPPQTTPTTFGISSSGYTLMVGSSTDLVRATADMTRFDALGHPVALLSYEDADGNLRHRIAVGQFASISEADSARQSLAGDLPSGTWVRRIRR